jgi:competence protein ComEA
MHSIRPLIRTGLLRAALFALLLSGSTLAAGERVNINTADAATLDRVLDGVGPSKAEAIIAYRKANGAFRSADQLASVKGIGLATVERNRDRIVVAGGATPAGTAAARPAVATAGTHPAARPVARAAAGSR